MNSSTFKIIDIKNSIGTYHEIWNDCLLYIKDHCHQDSLYENYLSIDLDKFLNFTGLVHENRIICFGAVDSRPKVWGNNIVRALTRFWIHPEYRSKGLTKWRDNNFKFSPTILKAQLDFIKTSINHDAVIITREGNYLRSFKEIVRLANTVSKQHFEIMPGKVNVCKIGDIPRPSCLQFVATDNVDYFLECQGMGFFKRYE